MLTCWIMETKVEVNLTSVNLRVILAQVSKDKHMQTQKMTLDIQVNKWEKLSIKS